MLEADPEQEPGKRGKKIFSSFYIFYFSWVFLLNFCGILSVKFGDYLLGSFSKHFMHPVPFLTAIKIDGIIDTLKINIHDASPPTKFKLFFSDLDICFIVT